MRWLLQVSRSDCAEQPRPVGGKQWLGFGLGASPEPLARCKPLVELDLLLVYKNLQFMQVFVLAHYFRFLPG